MDKIAKKEKDEQLSKDINKAIVGGYVIQKGSLPVRHSLGKKIVNAKTDISGDELRNIVKDFSKKEKVKVVFTDIKGDVVKANAMHPKYYKRILNHDILPPNIDKNKIKTAIDRKAFLVSLPRNEAAALHELGHVKDYKRANFNKIPKTSLATSMVIKKGIPILVAAPLASGKVREKIREIDLGVSAGDKAMNFVEKHPYLSAATVIGAPTIYREGKASGYAIGQLVKKHGFKKGLSRGKLLAPALGTYLAGAVGKSAIIGTGYKINKAYNDKKRREMIEPEIYKQAWVLKNKERGLYDDSYKELNKLTVDNPDISKKDMYRAIYREWNNHPDKDKAVNEFMIGNKDFTDRFKNRNTLKQSKGSIKTIDNDIALRIKSLKSQDDINNFIKGASLDNNQLEKIAIASWKKNIGTLSEASKKLLVDKGILNYNKELSGLKKGTTEIAKKLNIKRFKNHAKASAHVAKGASDSLGIKDKVMRSEIMDQVKQFGSTFSSPEKMNILKSRPLTSVPKNTIKSVTNSIEKDFDTKLPSIGKRKDRLSNKYVKALFERHEVDEVREGARILKNKKLTFKEPEYGKAMPATSVFSHLSPKVIARESANASVAPPGARKYMNSLRDSIGEKDYLSSWGVNYGKGPYNKKLGNKMEKTQARFIKDQL